MRRDCGILKQSIFSNLFIIREQFPHSVSKNGKAFIISINQEKHSVK